MVIYKNGVIGA